MAGDLIVYYQLACIFPPAAAAFVAGCGADLCLNILLTMLGYFPGCIHAFWLVIRRAEANETYGYKNWRYVGMGEYAPSQQYGRPGAPAPAPYGRGPPPPPPPGQYPAGQAPPPSSQAPVDQKGGYTQPPPIDQKYTGSGGDQAPPQAPVDQKQSDAAAQSAAPAGGT